ncbi:MAG TPA: GNAT family N-acetyltransferase [Anaerolineales bacterium]|jgi:N-acetylglutamate synthase-like GNAT family acetyltransferase|nr:GNAT family N-acetyltransferase [Anaerolineales bacterium]
MFRIRHAMESEAAHIQDLIHVVGINPLGLDWKRFVVAVDEQDEILGCGQIKPHGREVRELASIAVYPEHQGKGIGSALIRHLLQDSPRPVYLMCESANGTLYEKFGFREISYDEMPRYFRRISKVAGLVTTLARREEHLLIMKLQ